MADYPISNVARRVVFSGSSGVGPYAFTFEILAETDLAIYIDSTLKTLTTHYTVTINANGTGSVTFTTGNGPTSSQQVTVVGSRAVQRLSDFVTGGDFFATTLNDELDSQTIFIQQVAETAERGLKAPVTDPTDISMTLPRKVDRKGKVLAFDETSGDPVAGPDLSAVTTVIAQSANINTVATNIASVNTAATNMAAIIAAPTHATNAAASYDAFDDRYLGSKATAPAVDNDGNALLTGALYWNTATTQLYIWTGSAWNAAAFNTSDVATLSALAASSGSNLVGYTQGGTGAVATTVQAKLRETISVQDFGAVGDGVTNDVSAFQNAINATPNSGIQVILVPSGSYAGDMLGLDFGNRNIVWNEQGSVAYVTAYPSNSYSDVFSGTQSQFSQSVFPEKHLKRFSTVRAGDGSGAIPGLVTIAAGVITNIAVASGGSNYSSASARVLITGDGSGAVATATVAGGVVTAINITSGGTGYTQATVYVVNGPVVVIAGDSISTPNPTGTSPVYDGQYEVIRKAIQSQNPNRNITFFNRAVGATTWTSFDQTPSGNFPGWYTNTSKPWIDYIEELKPDLVICAFGMNDRQNFVPSRLRSSIAKLIAFDPRPDVVLCTNMVPTAISSDAQFSSQESQIGRDFVAGYTRGYALTNNYGLIDIHRQFRLIRDGKDHRQTNLRYFTVDATQSLPYSFPQSGEGLFIKATFDCSPGPFWTAKAIELQISPAGANCTEYVRLSDNAGKLTVSVQEYSGSQVPAVQFSINTVINTPTSSSSVFEISVVDQTLSVYVDGIEACTKVFAKAGGVLTPVLRRVDISVPASPFSISDTIPTINAYAVGQYAQYQPRLNDYQLWGYGGASNFGGNEVNHPSSFCSKYVIAPVVYDTNFNQSGISVRSDYAANSNFIGVNESAPVALLHVTKTGNSTTLTPAATANNILIEDASNAGMSLMTPDTGACRINFGDATNNSAGVLAFSHTTDRFSHIVQGETTLSLGVPTVDTITSAQLLVKIGATLIVKQVSVGAANSGGAGYRLLLVPN